MIDTHQLTAAGYLAQSLGLFWETQDYLLEGDELVRHILAAADTLPIPLQADLHRLTADFARHRADYGSAEQHYTLALSEPQSVDVELYSAVWRGRGEIAFRRGDYRGAADAYEHYLAFGEEQRNPFLIADGFNALGRLAGVQGLAQQAHDLHQQGKRLAQHTDYAYGVGWHYNAIGELHRLAMRFDAAVVAFQESAILFRQLRDYGAEALVQQNLAFTSLAAGKIAEAEALFKQVMRFWLRGSAKHAIALCLIGLAGIRQAQGNITFAASLIGFADQMLQQAGIRLEIPDSLIYEQVLTQISKYLGWQMTQEWMQIGRELSLAQILNRAGWYDLSQIPTAALPQRLTPREHQIMRLVAEGLTDKQIARCLNIKPQTVNVHLKSVYQKFDLHTRTAAAQFFKQHYPST